MFDTLNKSFSLCPADYIKNISELKSENDLKIVTRYFDYCDYELEQIVQGLTELGTTNENDVSVSDFERVYQPLIENRLEDIQGEMFLIQTLIAENKNENEYVKEVIDRIDMITAMLILVPEKLEKTKCLMLAFESADDYGN